MPEPKLPGPDHPIEISPQSGHVSVIAGGKSIVETDAALSLQEAKYPAVLYIPREDADMAALEPSSHKTYCPYKGECSYFSIPGAGARGENAVWSYEAPYPSVAAIKNHLAFYPDRVDEIRLLPKT